MADIDNIDDIIRLGCPFCRRNPERYKKCRSCNGAGFTELSQVKDHLKRVHPPKCPNCSFVFAGHPIEEHARRHPSCKYRPKEELEYMTEKQWQDIRKVPKRCRNTSPGEQWRVIFRKLFGNSVPIPTPYLPSLAQYRRIAGRPSPGLLSALETRILTSGLPLPFFVDENSLRFCLRLVVPALFDLVGEHGLLPGDTTPMPGPVPQAVADHSEQQIRETGTVDHHDIHNEAEDILWLADMC